MKRLLFTAFVAVWLGENEANAQNITIVPDQLSSVPIGGLLPQRYWQQLLVTLSTSHPASDESMTMFLPDGLKLLDSDNDGQFRDEVRVAYDAIGFDDPSIFVSDQTDSGSIVLGSLGNIAESSEIYIQFPVYADLNTPVGVSAYGEVLFANEAEPSYAKGPEVRFVDESQWSELGTETIVQFSNLYAAGADTIIIFDGNFFPKEPKPIVEFLPDLVVDRSITSTSNILDLGDKIDDNDLAYSFFWSKSSDLVHIDTLSLEPVLTSAGVRYSTSERHAANIQLDLRGLAEGSYFLYAISNMTEDLALGRSRRIQIVRPPQINSVGPIDDVTLDSGGLYNVNGVPDGKGPRRIKVDFEINDADDTPEVYLFASQDSTLTVAANSFNAEGLPELADAELLNKTGPIGNTDSFFWEFSGNDFVAEGVYYVYALVSDGNSIVLERSMGRVHVFHSPYLRFDTPTDGRGGKVDTIFTGGVNPQRYLTFTWGEKGFNGDSDLDDNALIDLYYSSEPAGKESGFELPSTDGLFTALLKDKAWVIAGGIEENGDAREENQYVWDLWSLDGEENSYLVGGQPYYFYGLISDGKHRRFVQINGGQENDHRSKIIFDHPPTLMPTQPVDEIKVGPGDLGRVAWDAIDIDDDARIRVLLVSSEFGPVAKYRELIEDVVYVVNSFDGYSDSEINAIYDLSEDESGDYIDFSIDHLARGINIDSPPAQGTYNVYVAITDESEFTDAWCWQAPGYITIANESLEKIVDLPISLWPEQFTMGNQGMLQTFELRITAEQSVDLIKTSILFDNISFSPIDQDPELEGLQPFYLSPNFSAAKLLKNSVSPLEDGSGKSVLTLEYLEPGTGNIFDLKAGEVLAYFEMKTLLYSGPTSLELKVGEKDQPLSLIELDGKEIGNLSDGVLSQGSLISGRAMLSGSIQLEGRVDMQTEATVQIRSNGSYLPISDSTFAITNDINPNRTGIQTAIETSGKFELFNVPAGIWDLYLLIDGYLPGVYRSLSANAGQVISGLQPVSDPFEGAGYILGGDVVGYVDENGELLADNEITLADWDYVASYFGLNAADGDSIRKADITADGKVDIVDLSIVGSNFSKRGLDPVYKTIVDLPSVSFEYEIETESVGVGDSYVIPITKIGSELLIGYQLELQWSETDWEWVSVTSSDGDIGMSVQRKTSYGTLWGFSSLGGKPVPAKLEWKLKARVSDPELPVVSSALVVDDGMNAIKALVYSNTVDLKASGFRLNLNYPNPFNPSTHIPFSVDVDGPISLVIYDVLGRPVKEIYNDWIGSGWYQMSWDGLDVDGREVASGVYLCRLKSNDEVETISMVLLR